MKRIMFLVLACCTISIAHAQDNGPAQPPASDVQMHTDGKCMNVRPGDTVHYTLTIVAVENAKSVVADLQLRPNGHARLDTSGGLPLPDFRSLGGGGVGDRDPQQSAVYHFVFKVPVAIFGGVYRGVGVVVTTDEDATARDAYRVDVTHHAREQVSHYCLNVISGFGGPEGRPEVTDFKPGPVDEKK